MYNAFLYVKLACNLLILYLFYITFVECILLTMPNTCCLEGCHKAPPDVTLHRFPKDSLSCRKWKEALGKHPDWVPTESDRVCSSHFDPTMINRCKTQVRLIEGAVPRIEPSETTVTDRSDHT